MTSNNLQEKCKIFAEDRSKDKIISSLSSETKADLYTIFNNNTFQSEVNKAVKFQPNDQNGNKQLLYIQFTEETEHLLDSYLKFSDLATNDKKIKTIRQQTENSETNKFQEHSIKHIFSSIEGLIYFQRIFPSAIFKDRTILKGVQFHYDQNFIAIRYDFDAIYDITNKKLYFYKFATIAKFLDVSDFYRKATQKDLDTFNNHDMIALSASLLRNPSEANLRKIASIIDDKKLEKYKIEEIQKIITQFSMKLTIVNDQVILNKAKDINSLYKILNTQFYIDVKTGEKRIVDSYRAVLDNIKELESEL